MSEFVEDWRDPLLGTPPARIPVGLAARLEEMAVQTAAEVDVPDALSTARLPGLEHPLPYARARRRSPLSRRRPR